LTAKITPDLARRARFFVRDVVRKLKKKLTRRANHRHPFITAATGSHAAREEVQEFGAAPSAAPAFSEFLIIGILPGPHPELPIGGADPLRMKPPWTTQGSRVPDTCSAPFALLR
jgi:hypothetical protein